MYAKNTIHNKILQNETTECYITCVAVEVLIFVAEFILEEQLFFESVYSYIFFHTTVLNVK